MISKSPIDNVSAEKLSHLFDEFLLTLDDVQDYWDGVFLSDKDIASRFLGEFLDWLRVKQGEKLD